MNRSKVTLIRRPQIRKRWPVGAYAELVRPEALGAQLIVMQMSCASLADAINARFGSPTCPQVVSRQMLSKLKTGKAKRCTPVLAERICSVLGLDPSLLFVMHGLHNHGVQNAQRVA